MAAPTKEELQYEEEIAQILLRGLGGHYLENEDNQFAHFDRVWEKDGVRKLVECRQRKPPYKWEFFDTNPIFIDTRKLGSPFIFVVRDMEGDTRYADIDLEKLVILRSMIPYGRMEKGQDGKERPVAWVSGSWFVKINP